MSARTGASAQGRNLQTEVEIIVAGREGVSVANVQRLLPVDASPKMISACLRALGWTPTRSVSGYVYRRPTALAVPEPSIRPRRLLPEIRISPWGGGTDDGRGDVEGRSLSIEWLDLFVEIAIGRVAR